MKRMGLKRWCRVVGMILVVSLLGCDQFETSEPTETTGIADSAAMVNCLVGDAEDTDWAAYYVPGKSYFKVTLPLRGVAIVRYYPADGGCFALYYQLFEPVTVEVGLTEDVVLDSVIVEYVMDGSYAAVPEEAVPEEYQNYVQYLRPKGDGLEYWWPCDTSGFRTSASSMYKVIILNGTLQVAQGSEAQRPTPTLVPTPASVPTSVPAPAGNYTLTVTVDDRGTVTSTDGAINCGTTCSASYPSGTTVTLNTTNESAGPSGGAYSFREWSGDCSGTGACTVTMDADKAVTATFTYSWQGYWWYYGGGTCDTLCSGHSGWNSATSTFWALRTDAECGEILSAFGVSSVSQSNLPGQPDGCRTSANWTWRAYGSAHQPDTWYAPQVCACND